MTDKKILIVDEETLYKLDENRGEMSRAEFISFLINSQLGEKENNNATKITKLPIVVIRLSMER